MKPPKVALALAALASIVLLAAAPVQPALVLAPNDGIEGSWTMVELDGKPYPSGYFWVIDKNQIRIIIGGRLALQWSYTLNRSASPLEIKIPGSGYRAICKRDGDRLLVSLASGTNLPTLLKPAPGHQLYDFKRGEQK